MQGTITGGLVTFGLGLFILIQCIGSIMILYRDRDFTFQTIETVLSDQVLSKKPYTFSDYDNSLNFAFGVKIRDFDNANNPYIQFIAYSLEFTAE